MNPLLPKIAWMPAAVLIMWAGAALAAQATDPDWPCMQRKVPTLTLMQVWSGPPIVASGNWSDDPEISALVSETTSRRMSLADATALIDKSVKAFGEDADAKVALLAQGLVDHVNSERSQVISGIARYAARQRNLAAQIREEAASLNTYRNDANADAVELERRTAALNLKSRIYQERVQSLRYVCEVPTQFEQRLYALLKAVAASLKRK